MVPELASDLVEEAAEVGRVGRPAKVPDWLAKVWRDGAEHCLAHPLVAEPHHVRLISVLPGLLLADSRGERGLVSVDDDLFCGEYVAEDGGEQLSLPVERVLEAEGPRVDLLDAAVLDAVGLVEAREEGHVRLVVPDALYDLHALRH